MRVIGHNRRVVLSLARGAVCFCDFGLDLLFAPLCSSFRLASSPSSPRTVSPSDGGSCKLAPTRHEWNTEQPLDRDLVWSPTAPTVTHLICSPHPPDPITTSPCSHRLAPPCLCSIPPDPLQQRVALTTSVPMLHSELLAASFSVAPLSALTQTPPPCPPQASLPFSHPTTKVELTSHTRPILIQPLVAFRRAFDALLQPTQREALIRRWITRVSPTLPPPAHPLPPLSSLPPPVAPVVPTSCLSVAYGCTPTVLSLQHNKKR